jgi:GNAT superfamily N-acetyltransferase
MDYFKNLWSKVRFSSPLRIVTDILGRLGVRITPYYVYLEGLDRADLSSLKTNFTGYETVLLESQDMKEIAEIPGRKNLTEQSFLDKLDQGHLCLGMKHDGKLAGFNWANLSELTFSANTCFTLKDNEAYLYDAYTLMDFRGIGIAPYIRYRCYQQLEQLGKNRLYSISLAFNTPAINFKKKLNAELYELRLFIDIFRKWEFNMRLKQYSNTEPER